MRIDFTHLAIYLAFGFVLSASGHSIEDITYWLLFILLVVSDIHTSRTSYREGLESGSRITKEIWGIK